MKVNSVKFNDGDEKGMEFHQEKSIYLPAINLFIHFESKEAAMKFFADGLYLMTEKEQEKIPA